MKLRECIKKIQEVRRCNKQDAIYELNEIINIEDDGVIRYGFYRVICICELNIKGLTKIQALKKKNKFERRLIKLAEAIENK